MALIEMIKDQTSDIKSNIQTEGLTGLLLNNSYTDANLNIDRINAPNGYVYRFTNYNSSQGTFPTGLSGNGILLIGYSYILSNNLPQYGVQIAFSFGSDKIAIRHASYNASGAAWGAWKYLTAT